MNEVIKLPKSQARQINKLCEAYYRAPIHRGGAETPQKTAARKAYGTQSAKLAKRHFKIIMTPEEAFRSVDYHQTDWTMKNPGSFKERLSLLGSILNGQPKPEELNIRDLFGTLYFVHDYTSQGDRPVGTAECGSVAIKDTPRGLYRLLYLTGPKALDFDDMYKTGGLICLCSPDYQFVASAELWKYELALRFDSTRENIEGRLSAIQCGVPGSNNGVRVASPLLKQWCDTLSLCLKTKWNVYYGNNFVV